MLPEYPLHHHRIAISCDPGEMTDLGIHGETRMSAKKLLKDIWESVSKSGNNSL